MFDYNVQGGKFYRGGLVVSTAHYLCKEQGLDWEEYKPLAAAIGWSIEFLQACFLVADDIMDKSITRRGQPCWYKLPDVQMDAINDSLVLESMTYWLIQHVSKGKSQHLFLPLSQIMRETRLQTELGQMCDLVSQPQGLKGTAILNNFTSEQHRLIVVNKTAIYTFYAPVALALTLVGRGTPEALSAAKEIGTELGVLFQIQDDILDCFGDPSKIGKIGTDIQDHKCTWLVMMALRLASPQQRKIIEEHYGQHNEKSVQTIKDLYRTMELPQKFEQYEEESYKKIKNMISRSSSLLPPPIYEQILNKVYKRQK